MARARLARLAVFKFASCDGCQLSLLDCEDELLAIAAGVQIAYFPEATSALRGFNASAVRVSPDGMLIMSAAVPVQRYKQVLGALILTRDNRAIAASLRADETTVEVKAAWSVRASVAERPLPV